MTEQMKGTLAIPQAGTAVDEENPLIEERAEEFAVTDFKSAEWVVSRIRAARDYADRCMAWAQVEANKAKRAEEFFLLKYKEQLKALVEDTTRGTNKKSLSLPSGRLQLRQKPVRLEVVDQIELVSWLIASGHADLVRLKTTISCSGEFLEVMTEAAREIGERGFKVEPTTEVNKTLLNELFQETGEIPPGTTIRGGEDELYIQ